MEELSNELVGIEGKLLVADARRIVSRSLDRWGAFENDRLGRAMRDLGWERRYLRDDDHQRRYFYVKGDQPVGKVVVVVENNSQVRTLRGQHFENPSRDVSGNKKLRRKVLI